MGKWVLSRYWAGIAKKPTGCSRRFFGEYRGILGNIAIGTNQILGSYVTVAAIGQELHRSRQVVLVVSAMTRSLTGTKNKEPIRRAVTIGSDLGLGGKPVETDSIVGSVLERRKRKIKPLEHS